LSSWLDGGSLCSGGGVIEVLLSGKESRDIRGREDDVRDIISDEAIPMLDVTDARIVSGAHNAQPEFRDITELHRRRISKPS